MTYSQLRAFHCVATYGGFSKAAEKTQHSQPVLSGHVKQLEEFHDNLLFKREKKRISLTTAGKELFILTKQFFEVEDQINRPPEQIKRVCIWQSKNRRRLSNPHHKNTKKLSKNSPRCNG